MTFSFKVYSAPATELREKLSIDLAPETDAAILQTKNAQLDQEQDASSAAIKIPVDNANKLLYDLDATVKQLFDNKVKEEKSEDAIVDDAQVYSAANRELDFYPRQTETTHQGASLVTQLENLEKRLLVRNI